MLPYQQSDDQEPCFKDAWLKTYYDDLLDYPDDEEGDAYQFGNPDDIHVLSWSITGRQWGEILACIHQGAVVLYPNSISRILYNYLRMVGNDMAFCDNVLDCILTRADIRDAIRGADEGGQGGGEANEDTDLVYDPFYQCDKDHVYGYCRALWNYINATNLDVLQRLSEVTNSGEIAELIVILIPGFGALAVLTLLSWIEALGNYAYEVYTSQLTTAIEDEIVCDLMCIAVEGDCHLRMGQVYDYFIEKVGGLNAPTIAATFAEWVLFMATGTYPGDRVVYLWTAFQLGCVAMGVKFLNIIDPQQYAIQARCGDPDDDWELLCDPCDAVCGVLTFEGGDDLSYNIDDGTLSDTGGNPDHCVYGDEWEGGSHPHGKRIELNIHFTEDKIVSSVGWDVYQYVEGFPGAELNEQVYLYNSSWSLLDSFSRTWQPEKELWQESAADFDDVANVRHVKMIHRFTVAETVHELRVDNYKMYCPEG